MEASHCIPAEVQDKILDELIEDPSALLRCSLVCQRWLDQSLRVYWSIHPLRFGTQRSKRANDSVIDLLAGDACKFVPYVQSIELQGHHHDVAFADSMDPFVSLVALSEITPSTLSLTDITFEALLPETIDILMSFKDLRSLSCQSVIFMDLGLFCKFFMNFRKLQTCSFGAFLAREDKIDFNDKDPLVGPSFNSLESFSTSICGSSRLTIPAIVQSQCKLQKLSLSWTNYSGYNLVFDLLLFAGEHLKELSLEIAHFASTEEQKGGIGPHLRFPLTLVHNTGLQRLEISEIEIERERPYPASWLEKLLRTISSPSFQRLRLQFRAFADYMEGYYLENFNWGIIEKAIPKDTGFTSKWVIHLVAEMPEWHLLSEAHERRFSEDFRSRLPELDRAGRLEIEIIENPFAQILGYD